MSTPYWTPSFPAPPRPTPTSLTSDKHHKAPIYNPYDKFTQNEFDLWIGGITGALRRALGEEVDEEEQESVTHDYADDLFAPRNDAETEQTPEYEPEEQSEAEDSFAEMKTRLDKGKGRDPREGPGLGGRVQPIEISYSDSGEEGDEVEGEDEVEDDEEGGFEWREYDSDGNRYDESEEDEEGYCEEASGHRTHGDSPDDDIIELSSGENEEDEHAYEGVGRDSSLDADAGYALNLAKFGEPLPPPDEDEDAMGEDEREYIREEEHVQEKEEDDQAFPPRRSPLQPLDLADPWIGPQTYAEDFYSGGDIHEGVLDPALVSPSNLTPARALSEHTWEQDANGLLPLSPEMVHKETIIIDVDMDEDEKDEDLLPASSLLAPPAEDHDPRQHEYDPRQHEYDSREEESGAREGEYDENYVFRDDESLDEFLRDKVGDERPREADSSTSSPEISIAAQPQLDATPLSATVAHHMYSSPPVQDSNGQVEWIFPPAAPAGLVHSSPGHIVAPPVNGAPEIIELLDDDTDEEAEDNGGNYDENGGENGEAEEVEKLSSEDEDEGQFGTTRDLIRDFLPEAEEEDVGTPETTEEVFDHAFNRPEPSFIDDSLEDSGVVHNEDPVNSADQEDDVDDVARGPEIISVDGSEEGTIEEMHEVPADVRFKASLLENFLASADTMAKPTWDAKGQGQLVNLEQQPMSFTDEGAAEANTLGSSIVHSTAEALPEDHTDVVNDAEHGIEDLADEGANYIESTDFFYKHPDDLRDSDASPGAITAEPVGQEGTYHMVSEVMTADYTGEFVSSYITGEPVFEGRETEEPADQDIAKVNITAGSPRRSESPMLVHPPDPEPTQAELDSCNDTRPNRRTSSPGVIPAPTSVNGTIAPEHQQSNAIVVLAREPFVEENGEEKRIPYTFPMPISANPSVPDPEGIARTPDNYRTSQSPLLLSETPCDSSPALNVSAKDSSETPPPFPLETLVRQESFSNTSASDLFTPRNETATAPASPSPQPAKPREDDQLTHPVQSTRLTLTIPEASFVPAESTGAMDDGVPDGGTPRPPSEHLEDTSFHPVTPSGLVNSSDAVWDEDDPFKLMGNDSKIAPGAVDDQASFEDRNYERTGDLRRLSPKIHGEVVNAEDTQVSENKEAVVKAASFYQNGTNLPSNGFHSIDGHESVGHPESKPSKRKRTVQTSIPARLTRSMSTKINPTIYHKGKGKAKAENDAASENGSSSSGASVASKMLRLPSRDTSRASSVVSTQSVESSTFSVQQSPTVARQSNSMDEQNKAPILYHVHSTLGLHHHHSRPSAAPRPLRVPKSPLSPFQSKDVSQPSGSQPSPLQRTASVAHSPVTRSNCRFHKISLPREEGGPRVTFIVPGCSLGDRTLMDEEDIRDDGDATTLDHARMVGDIETLNFSSELVGVLRQLVGVDLLRENEIFYLPQPGESYRRKRHGKSILYTARPSSGDFTGLLGLQSAASSPLASKISSKPSLAQAPISAAGSASTSAGSTGLNDREFNRHSPSAISHSDDDDMIQLDDSGPSQSKRRKGVSGKRNGVNSSEEMPPPSSAAQPSTISANRGSKARRSKKLSIDAHAYKPELEAEGISTDHESDTAKGRRKKTGKRGVKRNRTSEVVGADDDGQEQPMAKRLRARHSMPSSSGR